MQIATEVRDTKHPVSCRSPLPNKSSKIPTCYGVVLPLSENRLLLTRARCCSRCAPQVPLAKLFSYADKRDKVFMLLGTLAAVIQGW